MKNPFNFINVFSKKDKQSPTPTTDQEAVSDVTSTSDTGILRSLESSTPTAPEESPVPTNIDVAPHITAEGVLPTQQATPVHQPTTIAQSMPEAQVVPVPQPATQPIPEVQVLPVPQPTAPPQPLLAKPTDAAPVLFHPNLLTLAQTLASISLTHELGNTLASLAYKMNLRKDELRPIAESIQKFIPSYQSALAQLKDTPDLLKEFIYDCQNFTTNTIAPEIPTYETFLTNKGVEVIKKESTMLSTLYKIAPELFSGEKEVNLMPLLQNYTAVLPKVNNHTTQTQALLPIEETLRKEILKFTETITQMQSNQMMAVNWNSQKPAFIKLRQELDIRRNNFLQEEANLNQAIASTYEQLLLLHQSFLQYTQFLASLFENILPSVSPNPQIIAQRKQINEIIVSLIDVQNTLVTYINTL